MKTDATYEDLMMRVGEHADLKCMVELSKEEGAVFFLYKGCENRVMVIFQGEAHVKPFDMPHETNPELLYILSYSS